MEVVNINVKIIKRFGNKGLYIRRNECKIGEVIHHLRLPISNGGNVAVNRIKISGKYGGFLLKYSTHNFPFAVILII